MATQTASITFLAADTGAAAYYSIYSTTFTTGVFPMGNTLIDLVTSITADLIILSGASACTHSYVGSGLWGVGDTTVTWTLVNPTSDTSLSVVTDEGGNYYHVNFIAESAAPSICNDCQFIQLNQCGNDSFYVDLGLPDANYTAYYTDNTSEVVWEQGTYSSAILGGLYVYQWNATAGMFNQYSFYTLTIKDSNGDPVSWTVDGVEYTCATLTFKVTVNVTD